jgi:hypothetical protein
MTSKGRACEGKNSRRNMRRRDCKRFPSLVIIREHISLNQRYSTHILMWTERGLLSASFAATITLELTRIFLLRFNRSMDILSYFQQTLFFVMLISIQQCSVFLRNILYYRNMTELFLIFKAQARLIRYISSFLCTPLSVIIFEWSE